MKTRLSIIAVVALLATPALFANHYADFYVIPVAGHTRGVNGTNFMSDVSIQNFSNAPLNVELDFVASGEGNVDNIFPITAPGQTSSTVTVPAGGSVLLRDVLAGFSDNGVIGAILIGADRPFAVTSRAYSQSGGGTYGQTVPAIRDFLDNTIGTTNNAGAVAYVPGIVSSPAYRTNLGFVAGNTSLQPLIIEVMIKDANGASLGTRTFVVQSGSFTQLQFPVGSVTNNRTFDIAGAEFRIREGNGAVVPYASVIDNVTSDAVFITGQFPANTGAGKGTFGDLQPSVFRQLFDRLHQ